MKVQICETFECLGQIYQIIAIFETTDQFFKFCINVQGNETYSSVHF